MCGCATNVPQILLKKLALKLKPYVTHSLNKPYYFSGDRVSRIGNCKRSRHLRFGQARRGLIEKGPQREQIQISYH
jgi:hypothetical protein